MNTRQNQQSPIIDAGYGSAFPFIERSYSKQNIEGTNLELKRKAEEPLGKQNSPSFRIMDSEDDQGINQLDFNKVLLDSFEIIYNQDNNDLQTIDEVSSSAENDDILCGDEEMKIRNIQDQMDEEYERQLEEGADNLNAETCLNNIIQKNEGVRDFLIGLAKVFQEESPDNSPNSQVNNNTVTNILDTNCHLINGFTQVIIKKNDDPLITTEFNEEENIIDKKVVPKPFFDGLYKVFASKSKVSPENNDQTKNNKEKELEKSEAAINQTSKFFFINSTKNHGDKKSALISKSEKIKSVLLEKGIIKGLGENQGESTKTDLLGDMTSEGLDDSEAENELFDMVEKSAKGTYQIFPSNKFKQKWDLLMVVLIAYVVTFLPYKLSFVEETYLSWNIFDYVIDFIFFIDIIFEFFTVSIDDNENMITDKKKIACKYQKFWFWIDFISVFPLELFTLREYNYQRLLRIIKLQKLYKILKLSKFFRLLNTFNRDKSKQNKYNNFNEYVVILPLVNRLIKNMISIIIFIHLFACFINATKSQDRNITFYGTEIVGFDRYINSVYWIVQTVITVGYGDVNITTSTEQIFAILAMFAGVIFFSFTISSQSSIINNLDLKNVEYQKKLNILFLIQNEYNLENDLMVKQQNTVKHEVYKGGQNYQEFLDNLPENIRDELSYIMFRDLVEGIKLFEKNERKLIARLGPLFKVIKFGQNEVIFCEDEYANEIYFIKKGSVSYVLEKYADFPFISIKEGFYFGEVDVMLKQTRKMKIIAETDIELLVLSAENFNKVFVRNFPKHAKLFYNRMLKRSIKQIKSKEEAIDCCENLKKIEMNQFLKILAQKNSEIESANKKKLTLSKLKKKYSRKFSSWPDPNFGVNKQYTNEKAYSHCSSLKSNDFNFIKDHQYYFGCDAVDIKKDQNYKHSFLPSLFSVMKSFEKKPGLPEDEMMDKIDEISKIVFSHQTIVENLCEKFDEFCVKVGWDDNDSCNIPIRKNSKSKTQQRNKKKRRTLFTLMEENQFTEKHGPFLKHNDTKNSINNTILSQDKKINSRDENSQEKMANDYLDPDELGDQRRKSSNWIKVSHKDVINYGNSEKMESLVNSKK